MANGFVWMRGQKSVARYIAPSLNLRLEDLPDQRRQALI